MQRAICALGVLTLRHARVLRQNGVTYHRVVLLSNSDAILVVCRQILFRRMALSGLVDQYHRGAFCVRA